MAATPRIVRPIALPSAPRLRRVAGVNARPLGKISLFLAATLVLGLTSLCYVWQVGQATKTAVEIRQLNQQLEVALNKQSDLEDRIQVLQGYTAIYEGARKYGMVTVDPGAAHFITVPSATTRYVTTYQTPRPAARAVHLSTTDATMAAWWQGLWSALYNVTH